MSDNVCTHHGRLRCGDCLELEGLREENAKLRAALQEIADHDHGIDTTMHAIAREALAADDGAKEKL